MAQVSQDHDLKRRSEELRKRLHASLTPPSQNEVPPSQNQLLERSELLRLQLQRSALFRPADVPEVKAAMPAPTAAQTLAPVAHSKEVEEEDEDVCNRKHVKYMSEQLMEKEQTRKRKKGKGKKKDP